MVSDILYFAFILFCFFLLVRMFGQILSKGRSHVYPIDLSVCSFSQQGFPCIRRYEQDFIGMFRLKLLHPIITFLLNPVLSNPKNVFETLRHKINKEKRFLFLYLIFYQPFKICITFLKNAIDWAWT